MVEVRATRPMPMPVRESISRRVRDRSRCFMTSPSLIHKGKLVGFEQHLSVACPNLQPLGRRAGKIVLGAPGLVADLDCGGPGEDVIFRIAARIDDEIDQVALLDTNSV